MDVRHVFRADDKRSADVFGIVIVHRKLHVFGSVDRAFRNHEILSASVSVAEHDIARNHRHFIKDKRRRISERKTFGAHQCAVFLFHVREAKTTDISARFQI